MSFLRMLVLVPVKRIVKSRNMDYNGRWMILENQDKEDRENTLEGSNKAHKFNERLWKRIAIPAILILLCLFLFAQNNWLVLTRSEIEFESLPANFDGFTIVQISDLHSKRFGKWQQRLADKIAEAEPDLIVITGDLIDGRHYDEKASLDLVKKAIEIAPVYFVTGNHEWWSGRVHKLEGMIREAGADVVGNESRKLSIGDQCIYLIGLDDPESANDGYRYNDAQYIQEKLHDTISLLPRESFKILLSHRPELFHFYKGYGVDLAFCGHAHGGQFRLPLLGGFYAPQQGYFPQFTSGAYRDGTSVMVVSRGLGNSVVPQRLFNRPEVVSVTLRAIKEQAETE